MRLPDKLAEGLPVERGRALHSMAISRMLERQSEAKGRFSGWRAGLEPATPVNGQAGVGWKGAHFSHKIVEQSPSAAI